MSTSKAQSHIVVQSSTALCLACSSSLPPRLTEGMFITPCCQQPICSSCISSNPRLARYNPCLACLGGVDAVGPRSSRGKERDNQVSAQSANIDGAVRDEETFILGDDEDDMDDEVVPPPPYLESSSSASSSSSETVTPPNELLSGASQIQENLELKVSNPSEYYIKRGDTLQGIALRFAVDGRELCRLNKLPPSTLSTTPHILHTRTVLTLPPSASYLNKQDHSRLTSEALDEENRRAVRRAHEQAEKRLQTVTKEVDWRVAKAYVALADDPGEVMKYDLKRKEAGSSTASSNLEAIALDSYLADEEWEARELREGRKLSIPSIPHRGRKEDQDRK